MASSPEDAGACQMCEEDDVTTTVAITIGGIPAGPLFVCEGCAEGDHDD